MRGADGSAGLVAIATIAKSDTVVTRDTSNGHIPASVRVCASDSRKKPIATPDARAVPSPRRRAAACAPSALGSLAGCWLTSRIETMPRTMPMPAHIPGRSPSTTATMTGMVTAHTAVVGATTAMVPMARAR